MRYRLTRPWAYGVAIGAPLAAAVITAAVNRLTGGDVGFLVEMAAVLLVAAVGGLGPALLSTGLGALIGATVFLNPAGPGVDDPADQWRLFLFVATSLVGSALIESLHRARWRFERALAAQRTARRAERAVRADLESIVAAIGDGIIVCDAGGAIRLTNDAATRVLGRTMADVAELVAALATADEGPVAEEMIRAREPLKGEFRLQGQPTQLELSSFPIGDADDRTGSVILLRDVTTARRRDLLREAFLSLLSHELRTPITAIYGGASLLSRTDAPLEPDVRAGILKDVVDESVRLERLVEDLLVLARIDEGVEVGQEPALLQHLVPAVIERDWPTNGSGPAISVRLEANLPPVTGDETSIQQVLHNLVSNAAKYSPADSTIDLALEHGENEVVVRVLDRGRGLSRAETTHVFEPFYRSDAAKRMAAGAGIGLFVCRRLVEAMGGRIWAQPRDGGGAEFGFALPNWPLEPDDLDPVT